MKSWLYSVAKRKIQQAGLDTVPGTVFLDSILAGNFTAEWSLDDLSLVQSITEVVPVMGHCQVVLQLSLCPKTAREMGPV